MTLLNLVPLTGITHARTYSTARRRMNMLACVRTFFPRRPSLLSHGFKSCVASMHCMLMYVCMHETLQQLGLATR